MNVGNLARLGVAAAGGALATVAAIKIAKEIGPGPDAAPTTGEIADRYIDMFDRNAYETDFPLANNDGDIDLRTEAKPIKVGIDAPGKGWAHLTLDASDFLRAVDRAGVADGEVQRWEIQRVLDKADRSHDPKTADRAMSIDGPDGRISQDEIEMPGIDVVKPKLTALDTVSKAKVTHFVSEQQLLDPASALPPGR